MRVYENECRADKGKMFVVTQKGRDNSATLRQYKVGEPAWEKAWCPRWAVESGYLIEVDDPDWVTLPGYKAVYNHKGYELSVGNPVIFFDRETAERYIRGYKRKYKWFTEEAYVTEAKYEGKKPKPCREYNGKRVYNTSWFHYDAAEIGDYVENEIVDYAANCVPPVRYSRSVVQCGEPASSRIDEKTGREKYTYSTFVRVAEDVWEYCGDCFAGETEERGREVSIV